MEHTNPFMPPVNRQSFQIRRATETACPDVELVAGWLREGDFEPAMGFSARQVPAYASFGRKVIPCLKPASDEISTLDYGVTRSSALFSSIVVVDWLCPSNQLKITV